MHYDPLNAQWTIPYVIMEVVHDLYAMESLVGLCIPGCSSMCPRTVPSNLQMHSL
jgi:hypothetical protein